MKVVMVLKNQTKITPPSFKLPTKLPLGASDLPSLGNIASGVTGQLQDQVTEVADQLQSNLGDIV